MELIKTDSSARLKKEAVALLDVINLSFDSEIARGWEEVFVVSIIDLLSTHSVSTPAASLPPPFLYTPAYCYGSLIVLLPSSMLSLLGIRKETVASYYYKEAPATAPNRENRICGPSISIGFIVIANSRSC